jgi:hypothetical protein
MIRLRKYQLAGVVTALLLFSPFAGAQDQQQPSDDTSKPKVAARGIPAVPDSDQDTSGDQDSPPLQPDSRPLTGVQTPSLGSPEVGHSYFIPGVQFLDTTRSISLNDATGADWSSSAFVAGNMSLYRITSHSELSANYTGGGYFSTDSDQGSGDFHEVSVMQGFQWRKWRLSFIDQFSYLPESSFGFALGTGLSIPGIGGLASGLPALQAGYQPNQSILTSIGTRYSNAFATEAVRTFHRSSVNIAGTYSILRFLDPGNINSDMDILNIGYNYEASKADTVGTQYRFTEYHFFGTPQGLIDHAIHLAYGRKITGRLALQLFGGPEIAIFRLPVDGQTQRITPSGGVTLDYAMPRSDIALTYSHGVSNGGGILIGSDTDQLTLQVGRRITRRWQGSVSFGFARNSGLGTFLNVDESGESFDSYVVGGALNHSLARNATLTLAYSARIQVSTDSVCAAGTCGTNYIQHQVNVGVSWHARPFVLH